MAFSTIHTGAACNRRPHCLDWGHNDRIAYAACNAILILKIEESSCGKVEHTLLAHKKLVTSVKWICKAEGVKEKEVLSTSIDGTAIIWTWDENNKYSPHVLNGHMNAVQTADAVYCSNSDDLVVVTASTDSTVKVWSRTAGETNCVQTLFFGHGFATAVKLTLIETKTTCPAVLLALATDDFKIHLHCKSDEDDQFFLAASLSGPEDWIHGLDFTTDDGNLLLATGSQDHCIRLWKIKREDSCSENISTTLKLEKIAFEICGCTYSVMLESLFMGHSDWIYSVKWHQSVISGTLQILSASMDKSVILWSLDSLANLWLEEATLGDIGGNTLGYFGAVISPCGKYIVVHGYQGAIDVWFYNNESCNWQKKPSFGGHFGPVQDIAWDPKGAYLLSCSLDQTTRLYAPWGKANNSSDLSVPYNWSEIARPQIHGYDVICLSVLNRFSFVSGADEKILRVFKAPRSFAQNLKNLCGVETSDYLVDSLPEGASVPSLGLSNQAVFDKDIERVAKEQNDPKHAKEKFPEFSYIPVLLSAPPTENLLLQNTLWPEAHKLYGHPYEVFAVATNHQGTIIASACKASKIEHAAIILWDAHTMYQIGHLEFHALTVTQLEFSPDDEYLLSVSRDRMWAVYQRSSDQTPPYVKVANLEKKSSVHTRIIWSCSWSHDSLFFATSSRDKKVAVWVKNADPQGQLFTLASTPLEVKDSATAVRFAPCTYEDRYIIAVGLENGQIFVYSWGTQKCDSPTWSLHIAMDNNNAHHLTVNRLKFSPNVMGCEGEKKLLLASCGNDHFLRIYCLELLDFSMK